jgi:hypothetical protein
MRAAKHATSILTLALEEDDLSASILSEYETLWRRDFGNDFKHQLLAQKIFTSPFTDVLFEIGKRDSKIQDIVSEAMAESSQGEVDIKRLVLRTLFVCLKAAFGFK